MRLEVGRPDGSKLYVSPTCFMTFRCLKKVPNPLTNLCSDPVGVERKLVLFHIAVKSDIFFVKQYWSVVPNNRPPLEVRIGL